MSEKLYLPVSLLLSALMLSGTIFFATGQVTLGLANLNIAVPTTGTTGNTGNTGGTVAQPVAPAPTPTVTPPAAAAPVNMGTIIEGARVVFGPENAKVTIVEYSDFECPFCSRVEPTLAALKTKYGDQVRLLYKHFPLSFHPNARPAAIAAECAYEQGADKFAPYHAKLFANQTALTTANLKQFAVDIGLNAEQFNQCFDTSKTAAIVDAHTTEGSQYGVSGTPTFFIGTAQTGVKLVGAQPPTAFEAEIDRVLAS